MEIEGIKINFLGHSGFLIENGKKIAIDPYNLSEKVTENDIYYAISLWLSPWKGRVPQIIPYRIIPIAQISVHGPIA